jgi:hypothetical protein
MTEDNTGNERSEEANAIPVEISPELGDEQGRSSVTESSLLDRLLYMGVLPRYAFPTDVATFHVFDIANSSRYRTSFQFTPSQGLPVALSQYAPGKEVWIANRLFISGAIYSPFGEERYKAWRDRRLYLECMICGYACTTALTDGKKGDRLDCPACGSRDTLGDAKYWMRPPGFAHPCTWNEGVSLDDQPARSYATRAKLDAPTPPSNGDWIAIGNRVRGHYLRKPLLVTNSGPRNEGYNYCTKCGMIEPTATGSGALFGTHKKPFPDEGNQDCPGGLTAKGVCLGTDFITDVLLISMRVDEPVQLMPGRDSTGIALRTLSEAIAKAACAVLQLEQGEIQADYRAALTPDGQTGREAELYIYDTLPGGAGFSQQALGRLNEIFDVAAAVLDNCDCDSSCYRCLRSYKNKYEHGSLDRYSGLDLLNYLTGQVLPTVNSGRMSEAVAVLRADLERVGGDRIAVVVEAPEHLPGVGSVVFPLLAHSVGGNKAKVAVCFTHPLCPHTISNDLLAARELSTVPILMIDELRIRKNLPSATSEVLGTLGIT